MAQPLRVLYVESGLTGGGSFESLFQFLAAMDRGRFAPAVFFLNPSKYLERAEDMGIPVRVVRDPLYNRDRAYRHPRLLAFWERALLGAELLLPVLAVHLEIAAHSPTVRSIMQYARQINADVMHTNNQVNRDFYALEAARRLDLPCICHLRSFFTRGFTGTKARFANRHAACFVAYSSAVARHWIGCGLDPDKVRVIPNAIGPLQVDPLDLFLAFGIPVSRHVVGIVGKVIPIRGHEFLLHAFAKVVVMGCDAHLLVVGGGDRNLVRALKDLAERLGVAGRVTFAGEHSQAAQVIAALDVLVLPYSIEPFGRVLLEAWQLGTPVVLTRVGDIAAIVDHGGDGFLVDPGDESGLAESLVRLMEDRMLGARLSAAGREKCQRDFSMESVARQLEGLYDEVLGGKY